MTKINGDQLSRTLNQALSPVYLLCGDEPLLIQEATDSLRAAVKKQGYLEKETFFADAQFQWSDLLQSANSMSLFSDKKCLEVRLNSLKIGDAGSKALLTYCDNPNPDNVVIFIGPKADRPTQNSKWYKALEKAGTVVTVWPVHRNKMPQWIDQRLQKKGLKADSRAIDILAEKVEGNLLAAVQEIEKLSLLADDGFINAKLMASAVVDSARYDVFALVDKALAGDARDAAMTLSGLKSEGIEPPVILWALARDIRALINIKFAVAQGQSVQTVAKQNGIFDQRLPLIKAALSRLPPSSLRRLLKECELSDLAIKGMSANRAWDILLDVVMVLSGTKSLNTKSVVTLTQNTLSH